MLAQNAANAALAIINGPESVPSAPVNGEMPAAIVVNAADVAADCDTIVDAYVVNICIPVADVVSPVETIPMDTPSRDIDVAIVESVVANGVNDASVVINVVFKTSIDALTVVIGATNAVIFVLTGVMLVTNVVNPVDIVVSKVTIVVDVPTSVCIPVPALVIDVLINVIAVAVAVIVAVNATKIAADEVKLELNLTVAALTVDIGATNVVIADANGTAPAAIVVNAVDTAVPFVAIAVIPVTSSVIPAPAIIVDVLSLVIPEAAVDTAVANGRIAEAAGLIPAANATNLAAVDTDDPAILFRPLPALLAESAIVLTPSATIFVSLDSGAITTAAAVAPAANAIRPMAATAADAPPSIAPTEKTINAAPI